MKLIKKHYSCKINADYPWKIDPDYPWKIKKNNEHKRIRNKKKVIETVSLFL